jgi:hypothetical protein
MRRPPEPEEELTGELGHVDVWGRFRRHSVIFHSLLDLVNHL